MLSQHHTKLHLCRNGFSRPVIQWQTKLEQHRSYESSGKIENRLLQNATQPLFPLRPSNDFYIVEQKGLSGKVGLKSLRDGGVMETITPVIVSSSTYSY